MNSLFLIGLFNLASLKRLKAGDVEENDIKLKCYLRCFMMKSGILNENNNVDIEKGLRHLPRSMQESSREILNRCKSIRKFFSLLYFLFLQQDNFLY